MADDRRKERILGWKGIGGVKVVFGAFPRLSYGVSRAQVWLSNEGWKDQGCECSMGKKETQVSGFMGWGEKWGKERRRHTVGIL